MISSDPIGGYFELELPAPGRFPQDSAIRLNSGRACFEYVLRATRPAKVLLPKYTCAVLLEPIERLGVPYELYAITPNLELADPPELGPGDYLVYTNYFGLKDDYCRSLASRYGGRLILDCCQALFFPPPEGVPTFYSPRKFVGVADGGLLAAEAMPGLELERDVSAPRFSHLVDRIDRGAEAAYAQFQANDASLSGAAMKRMSRSTERILGSIDHERVRRKRLENYALLDRALAGANGFDAKLGSAACPMVYPFLAPDPELRRRLIEHRIFVATYWPNVLEWSAPGEWEHELAARLLPLPIDQRYGESEMQRIVDLAG